MLPPRDWTGQGLERQRKKQKEHAEDKRPFGVGMSYAYVTGGLACGVETVEVMSWGRA